VKFNTCNLHPSGWRPYLICQNGGPILLEESEPNSTFIALTRLILTNRDIVI